MTENQDRDPIPTEPPATEAAGEDQKPQEPAIDPAQLELAMKYFRPQQNIGVGAAAGFVAAVIGAVLWAVITVATGWQIGFMAIGVGFLVGLTMRAAGKGIDPYFGYVGGALALIGCLLGNFFTACWMLADFQAVSVFSVLGEMTPAAAFDLMSVTFGIMDLFFYGIAVYQGYKLSFRRFTEDELAAAARDSARPYDIGAGN